jgi:site-specific DNA recombinase
MDLLGIVRLSDFRETSASPEQQRKMMTDYADSHGHRIIHFVEDTDVSGDFGPFHPSRATAEWLNNHSNEYGGIICRAINRVARNAEQTLRLIRWAEHRNKVLISIKDGIDTSTDAGRTMAKFMAVVAEMELDQIKTRARDGHVYLTQVAKRWRGMSVPFGYRPYCITCLHTTGECTCQQGKNEGWRLEPDPTYSPILVQMVDKFLAGASFGEIVKWLNDTEVPTPANIQKMRYGKPVNPKAKWTAQSVRKIFTSHAMLGAIEVSEILERDDETGQPVKRSQPKPLYDDDGNLVLRAEPLVSYETWAKVQARINSNPQVGKPHVNASPLLHIAYCGVSGDPMYISTSADRQGNRSFRYYLCRKANHGLCATKRFNAFWLEEIIPAEVIQVVGHMPYLIPHITPAQEYSSALTQVNDAITNLWELAESGMFKDKAEQFKERLDILEIRKAELEAKPSSSEKRSWLESGKTIGQHWESLDQDQRWQFLRDMNIKAYVSRGELPSTFGAMKQSSTGSAIPLDIPQFVMTSDKSVQVTILLGTLRSMADAYNESAAN